jgi:C1A family cysteine protease
MAKKAVNNTPKPRKIQRYGWTPDLPDHRDLMFAAPLAPPSGLPTLVDLRSKCPPVYDQGQLGSCTGNSIAGGIQFEEIKQKLPNKTTPSRLFIYYNERVIEGTVSHDSGAQIRDGMKSVATTGYCFETTWPYDIAKFTVQPPPACYAEAKLHVVKQYMRLGQNLAQMKGCLAAGFPFVFGFTVYDSFESPAVAKTGIVPMPGPGESVLGGHAVLCVGYDDSKQLFIVRNSWGSGWGQAGYFEIPYAYLMDHSLSSDFWTIRML